NSRLNSIIWGSVSFWPRKRITRLSSQALRMAANVSAEAGLDASTPLTSAPSASPIFFMWIADMDFPVKGKFYLRPPRPPEHLLDNEKGLHHASPWIDWRPAAFEPTTPWFVGVFRLIVMLEYQRLTALANSLPSHIKAQFGHSNVVRVPIPHFA